MSQLPRPVGPPHLDLSHRHQPGAQPAALVAAAPPDDQVSLDEHLRQFGDLESKSDALPDRLLASKETATAHLAGARSAAVRSAHGAHPARDRRAALRRDRLLARRRGRDREVAAHARATGAARRAAGAPDMIPYLGCEHARELLDGFVDGELPMAEQVAARVAPALVPDLRGARRGHAADRRVDARSRRRRRRPRTRARWPRSSRDVLTRIRAEHEQSFAVQRARDVRRHAPVVAGARRDGARSSAVSSRRWACCRPPPRRSPESLAAMIERLDRPIRRRCCRRPTRDRIRIRCGSTDASPFRARLDGVSALESISDEERRLPCRRSSRAKGASRTYDLLQSDHASVHRRSRAGCRPRWRGARRGEALALRAGAEAAGGTGRGQHGVADRADDGRGATRADARADARPAVEPVPDVETPVEPEDAPPVSVPSTELAAPASTTA